MDRTVTIPTEHDIDLAFYYTHDIWQFRLELLNVTNQQNFAPVIGESSEFLQPLQPFALQGKIKVSF